MEIYTNADLPFVWNTIGARLREGHVGILPTDTIYGISGNALDPQVVNRIQKMKRRSNPPSFIPHSTEWAMLFIRKEARKRFAGHFDYYSGPFTTLWPYTDEIISLPGELCSTGLVGLRSPSHWINDLTRKIALPLVTTSVNLHGNPWMTCLEDLDNEIKEQVDFMVYQGELDNRPSAIVDCRSGPPYPLEER